MAQAVPIPPGALDPPGAGKRTLLAALSDGRADKRADGAIATVRVGDARVRRLSEIFRPKKTTFAEFKVRVATWPAATGRRSVVDLSGVEFVASMGIRMLLMAARAAAGHASASRAAPDTAAAACAATRPQISGSHSFRAKAILHPHAGISAPYPLPSTRQTR